MKQHSHVITSIIVFGTTSFLVTDFSYQALCGNIPNTPGEIAKVGFIQYLCTIVFCMGLLSDYLCT